MATSKTHEFLAGKKSYIIAFGAIVAAVVAYLTGEVDLATAANMALLGAGVATLRMGVKKAE